MKLWLVMHRAMGAHSPYHPYMQTLPAHVNTPTQYTGEQLDELKGTSLHGAVQVRLLRLIVCQNCNHDAISARMNAQ
jgi:hypothetical protein